MNDDQNPVTPPAGWQYRPGDAVTPTNQAAPAPVQPQAPAQPASLPDQPVVAAPAEAVAPQAVAATAAPAVAPAPEVPAPAQTAVPSVPTGLENREFATKQNAGAEELPPSDYIEWSASEYVAHQKSAKWYMVLMGAAVAIAAVAYLLTKDMISAGSIVLIALVFALSAARKPRVLNYQLDEQGLSIAGKSYDYDEFRSFAMVEEGALTSIALVPLKRLMPVLSIYYDPADEERIVTMLADHLPLEQRKLDAIDTLLHKIRF